MSEQQRMFEPDEVGRFWLDEDSFLAPFGMYPEDFKYVLAYIRDPFISKNLYHDGMDENLFLQCTSVRLKNGYGWIGFHKGKRSAFLILETISINPLVFALHGGIDRKLFGTGIPQKAMRFTQHYAFEKMAADKVEGYICHPNKLLKGYFKRGGMIKECEMRDRVSVNGVLHPLEIYGITSDEYHDAMG
jgi:RimJ/RimL family protein N-acetyltransferase